MSEIAQNIHEISLQNTSATLSATQGATSSNNQPEARLPIPESYDGAPNFCRAFLTHCSLHFSTQPKSFEREETKVAFVLTLLSGHAALWGTSVWENEHPL